MSRYYQRTTPGLRENLEAGMVAAGLAVGVGALTFYLVRLFLAREPLEPLPPARSSLAALEGQQGKAGRYPEGQEGESGRYPEGQEGEAGT